MKHSVLCLCSLSSSLPYSRSCLVNLKVRKHVISKLTDMKTLHEQPTHIMDVFMRMSYANNHFNVYWLVKLIMTNETNQAWQSVEIKHFSPQWIWAIWSRRYVRIRSIERLIISLLLYTRFLYVKCWLKWISLLK